MNKYLKYFKIGAIGVAALGVSACSDTWDDHYTVGNSTATTTLWEEFQSTPQLSDFTEIVEMTMVSRSRDEKTNVSYKDFFNSGSVFTVWAPMDGTYNADSIKNLLLNGGAIGNYNVENDFIKNHIARFNIPASGVVERDITMYNSKVLTFEGSGASYTMKEVNLVPTLSNIAAKNGTLHVVEGIVGFNPNMYEFLTTSANVDSIANYFMTNELVEFSEAASTLGPIVNGEVTYVDSVFISSNILFSQISARLQSEDSLYAMVIPTNKAWDEAMERLLPLYQLRKTYRQVSTATNEDGSTPDPVVTEINADSLMQAAAKLSLFQSGVFNARWQLGVQVEDYTDPTKYDSIKNTIGQWLYNNDSVKGLTVASDIFDNQTPVEVSNGYAFVVDNWNFKLNRTISPDLVCRNIESNTLCTTEWINVVAEDRNPEVTGDLYNNRYINCVPSNSSANPVITIQLKQQGGQNNSVLSGTYDIYAVIVPENITNNRLTTVVPNLFRGTLTYYDDLEKNSTVTLNSPTTGNYLRDESLITSAGLSGTLQAIDEDGKSTSDPIVTNKVDSVLLYRDFKFPVSYYGLDNAFPTLRIQSQVRTADARKYSRQLRINTILLVAKDE